MNYGIVIALIVVIGQPGSSTNPPYGTKSAVCALAIEQAIDASKRGDTAEAFTRIKQALVADETSEMAHYWHALLLENEGRTEEAIAVYRGLGERAMKERHQRRMSNITVDALTNLGLATARRGDTKESLHHFSQAIQLDLTDRHHLQWRPFRNMAISLIKMDALWPALLCAMKAKCLNPGEEMDQMVVNLAKPLGIPESILSECDVASFLIALAQAGALDTVTVNMLYSSVAPPGLPDPLAQPLPAFEESTVWNDLLPNDHKAIALLPMADQDGCYVFWHGTKEAHYVNFETKSATAIPLGRAATCAAVSEGFFYIGAYGIGAIDCMDTKGNITRTYSVPAPAQGITVCKKTNQAFVATGDTVYRLDLKTGAYRDTKIPGSRIVLDESRSAFYTLHQPRDPRRGYETGHIAVNGRNLFVYDIHTSSALGSNQALLLRAIYDINGNTHLAGLRTQVASNARDLTASADARWIAVTGAGGYRGPGEGGYGTAVFSADDLSVSGGLYSTEAHPKGAAFSRDGKYIATLSSTTLHMYPFGNPSSPQVHIGNFGTTASWSAGNRYLIVAGEKTGLHLFSAIE